MRWFSTEIAAVLAWVAASLLLAAAAVPWVYGAGQSLAEHAANGEVGGFLQWLGAACGRAKYGRFFDRTLLASALLLFPLLIWRLRQIKTISPGNCTFGLRKMPYSLGFRQCLVGLLIALLTLWCAGFLATMLGAFQPKPLGGFGRLFSRVLLPTLVTPLIEEWLFRGLLLGLWLRFSRPAPAIVGSSLVFAFLHFLEPPGGMVISSPHDALAGFQLLRAILQHFCQPAFLLEDFTALFGVGCVLAWVRCRTYSLWMPIGLHAGWILAFKGFNHCHIGVSGHSLEAWGVGNDLRSGTLPLLALVAAILILRQLPWIRHDSRRTQKERDLA